MNKETYIDNDTEHPEVGEVSKTEKQEDPFSKGRERIAVIGNFFSKAKEEAAALTSRVGNKISRFWSRTKKFGGEAVAATLSADVLAKRADAYVGEKAEQVGVLIGEKLVQADSFIGENAALAKEWTNDQIAAAGVKINQFDDYLTRKAGEGVESIGNAIEKSSEWVGNKANRAKEIGTEGVEIAKDVAFAVKEKTVEGFQTAKEGVKNQYNNVVEYGQNALSAAKIEASNIKRGFREKLNAWRIARLNDKIEKATSERERLLKQQVQEKVGLLSSIDAIEAVA